MRKISTNINLIKTLYEDTSLSKKDIATLANVSLSTIERYIRGGYITKRQANRDVDMAIKMYEEGYILKDIYNVTNTSSYVLYNELRDRDIPLRYPHYLSKVDFRDDDVELIVEMYGVIDSEEVCDELGITPNRYSQVIKEATNVGLIEDDKVCYEKLGDVGRVASIAKTCLFMGGIEDDEVYDLSYDVNVDPRILFYYLDIEKSNP